MDDTKSKISTLIRLLRNKPKMLLTGDSLNSYIAFFEGLFCGLEFFNVVNIERAISNWYQNQVKQKAPNMYWFAQFELVNARLTEQEKIVLLLDNLEQFFSENIAIFEKQP